MAMAQRREHLYDLRLASDVAASFYRFFLGALFDAQQLMRPQALESFRPLMQRTDRIGVRSIQHVPSVSPDPDQSDVSKHFKVLRNRRLLQPELKH
jgi:hypothetical protein